MRTSMVAFAGATLVDIVLRYAIFALAATAVLHTRAAAAPLATANEVADLYVSVGRELSEAARVDRLATIDLWARYRWVRIFDAIADPAKRELAVAILQRLRSDLRATTRGPGSAAD